MILSPVLLLLLEYQHNIDCRWSVVVLYQTSKGGATEFYSSIQGIASLIPLPSRILIIIWELLSVSVHLRMIQLLLLVPAQLRLPLASHSVFLVGTIDQL